MLFNMFLRSVTCLWIVCICLGCMLYTGDGFLCDDVVSNVKLMRIHKRWRQMPRRRLALARGSIISPNVQQSRPIASTLDDDNIDTTTDDRMSGQVVYEIGGSDLKPVKM